MILAQVDDLFQSTLPVGGATWAAYGNSAELRFQSTLPVGGATRFLVAAIGCYTISIHAPRGGSDSSKMGLNMFMQRISIHAPRGGSDFFCFAYKLQAHNFNPRSPWGERLPTLHIDIPEKIISIHAPRGGSDVFLIIRPSCVSIFQSTLPVGGATISYLTPRNG